MRKFKVNIDTWRLSYEQPQGTFAWLVDQFKEENKAERPEFIDSKDKYIYFGDWWLVWRQAEEAEVAEAEAADRKVLTEISADLVLVNGEALGQFHFNDTQKYNGLVFFTFTNKALYAHRGGCLAMLDVATDSVGRRMTTQTQLDIAVDVNFNLYLPIMRHIKDTEHYDMILNGNRVVDAGRTLQGVGEWFARSRKRRERFPTLYFEHSRSDGLKLRCYDKGKEIEASGKAYIAEANGFGGNSKIYRFEAVVKWWQFRQWLRHVNDSDTDCPIDWKLRPSETAQEYFKRIAHLYVEDADFCLALWSWACDHVLYFRDKQTNEKISIQDIVTE